MKLRERLMSWRTIAAEVSSVDVYQQGKECYVIVTARSGSSCGFCDNERRVNVLLTRAKRGFIVSLCWATVQPWKHPLYGPNGLRKQAHEASVLIY